MTSSPVGMTLHEFLEKIQSFWIEAIFTLLTSWVIIRQKFIRDEHNNMKNDIETLKLNQAALNATLENVKKNQELVRADVKETNRDVKILLGRRADDNKKGWFR